MSWLRDRLVAVCVGMAVPAGADCRASYMDAPSCQALLFDSGSTGRNCSHTFGLRLRFVAAGPDGICWLSPDHVSGLSMSHEALRLSQPRFYLFCHHLKKACAIVDV